jgi:single-stranded DNA-specific DHH superfamily exonuclease
MIKQAVEFIRNCSGKTIIVYDTDGDGIGAAVIISKTLKRIFNRYPKAIPADHDLKYVTRNDYDEISKQKAENIIIVDMSVDSKIDFITRLAKKHKILIIDHHQSKKNLNRNRNIVHANPFFWKSRIASFRYASSKVAFDICNKVTNIDDLDWLAGLGIINDYSGKSWKSFLNRIYKKHPYLKGKDNYSFENKLGYIAHIITSGYYSKRRSGKMGYDACLKAETPLDIIKTRSASAKKLKKMYNKVEKEIQSIMKNWRKKAEIFENKKLIILKLETRFSIQSTIATKVSIKKPDHTVVVAKKTGKKIHVSFRRQDRKVNCGELAAAAIRGLKNANGGGHAPAAGGKIMANDWNKFKEKIIRLL